MAGLAIFTLIVAAGWGWFTTVADRMPAIRYMVTHLNHSADDKLLYVWRRNALIVPLMTIKQKTSEDAVIGVSRHGPFGLEHWSLLYPRRVVVVDTKEEFDRERPTHLLVNKDFPPYPIPGDPRPKGPRQSADTVWAVQMRPPEPGSHPTLPQGWTRGLTVIVEGLAPLVLGGGLTIAIAPSRRRGKMCFLALAFLLGLGTHTLLLFGLSMVGMPLTSASVVSIDSLICLVSLAALFHRRHRFQEIMIESSVQSATRPQVALMIFIGLLLLVHLVVNLYWPVLSFDAVGSYDYRAKAIVQQGTVRLWQFFSGSVWVNFHYPFFITMLHAHHYLLGGTHPKVYYTLILGAFLVVFASMLKARGVPAFSSLLFTVFLAGNLQVFTLSQDAAPNFPQMVYGTLGLFFVFDYLIRHERADLLLSGLCLGLTGWIRTDSAVLLAVASGVMLVAGHLPLSARLKGLVLLFGCYGLITLPYEIFIRGVVHYDVAAYYQLSVMHLLDGGKLWSVLTSFLRYSLPPSGNYFFFPWLLAILAEWPGPQENRPLHVATGLAILAWVGLFTAIGSPDWSEIIRMSALRWYVNLTPLYVASIAQTDLMRHVFEVLEGRVPLRVRLEW